MILPALFGPYGSSALEFIDQFSKYGANAIWFHGFDPQAFEACQKSGIQPCVEFPTFRADFDERPELVPTGVDGRPVRYAQLVQGVCLSQSAFLDEIEASLVEGLRAYQPTGIWLDYLTYTGWFETPNPDLQDSCFCPSCIAEFCNATGMDAASPGEILKTVPELWETHKCERIAGFAARYSRLIRSHLPNCIIGAYMCPWLPDEFDHALTRIFAQDYSLLAPVIDIFTPLIYCNKSGQGHTWGRSYLEASPGFLPQDHPVQLILDILEFPDSLLATAESTVPSLGLQIYGGGEIFQDAEKGAVFTKAVQDIRKRLG